MRRRTRAVVLALAVSLLGLLAAFFGSAFFLAQRADYGWEPAVASPRFVATPPRVLFDEGHHNSSAGIAGRYWGFARLLRADGYLVVRARERFALRQLATAQVLVIVNPSGAAKPQIFGMNVPIASAGRRSDPAFTRAEIDVVRSWVEQGGSLLLVADHAPFGEAAADLGSALGVTMHKGFVEVPDESSDPLLFSTDNGRLGDHPIVSGDRPGTAVRRVMTYTGQSLDGPPGAATLLHLPATAVEGVPAGEGLVSRPAGPSQGLALERGRGRVVVLGEGAMLTAQVARRVPFGMNTGDNDNRQFALNVMHWLSRSP